MNPHRINILHVAYHDTGIVLVPHDLVLKLLPSEYALLD